MASSSKPPLIGTDTHDLPLDTKELRAALAKFLKRKLSGDPGLTIGGCKFGVYGFFDYDGEPIYVGQTRESLGTRIRRHLTNQRTDAVAMSVLDPFEVHTVKVWPLPQFQGRGGDDAETKGHLDALEATVYSELIAASRFSAILNEKIPTSSAVVSLPEHYEGSIATEPVVELRGHPDIRLARRAATIARLALVVCERSVHPGLRRTLEIQARRLAWLAGERLKPFQPAIDADDAKPEDGEQPSLQDSKDAPQPPLQDEQLGLL